MKNFKKIAPLAVLTISLVAAACFYINSSRGASGPVPGVRLWMTERYDYLKDWTLMDLVIPGTHDSGTYNMGPIKAVTPEACRGIEFPKGWGLDTGIAAAKDLLDLSQLSSWSKKTQNKDYFAQLANGIRFVQIRPYFDSKNLRFYTHHNFIADPITKPNPDTSLDQTNKTDYVLAQIKNFMEKIQDQKELVIVNFEPPVFCNMSVADHEALLNALTEELGSYMYTGATSATLFNTRLSNIVADGSKVVVNYQWSDPSFRLGRPNQGFYNIAINKQWPNKGKKEEVFSIEQNFLIANAGSATPNLVNWVITPANEGETEELNSYLRKFYDTIMLNDKNAIDIVTADFFEYGGYLDNIIYMNMWKMVNDLPRANLGVKLLKIEHAPHELSHAADWSKSHESDFIAYHTWDHTPWGAHIRKIWDKHHPEKKPMYLFQHFDKNNPNNLHYDAFIKYISDSGDAWMAWIDGDGVWHHAPQDDWTGDRLQTVGHINYKTWKGGGLWTSRIKAGQ